jgi:Class III cytochrome C family
MTVAIVTVTACLLPATSPGLTVNSISSVAKTDHERQDRAMTLDLDGKRGRVFFSHQKHESLITPDPNYPHKSISGVACVGCHHNVKQVTEANQFQKCSTCHKGEGDPDNPEDEEGYDLNAREIFHRSCIGCHRAGNLQASNERFINASFTRCDECHDRQGKYEPVATQSEERPSASEESEITAMITPPLADVDRSVDVDQPLGYAGPSRIDKPEPEIPGRAPVPDRWRIGFPGDSGYQRGSWLNPYRQNYLKGDYPIIGQRIFLSVTAESESLVNARRLPGSIDMRRPSTDDLFSRGEQVFFRQNFTFSFDLSRGDTAFKPVDWRINITPQFNINYLRAQRSGVVNVDPARGNARTDAYVSLQTFFSEVRLGDTPRVFGFLRGRGRASHDNPYFDSTSVRAGVQPFISDFRGFIFSDANLGVRLFGNHRNNRYQFNIAWFQLLEKDTNSELNTLCFRNQSVFIANLFRQDTKWEGYTTQFSFHYNRDGPDRHFDQNGFLVRPALIGEAIPLEPHGVKAAYLGWTGDGHIGRLNITHALYQVFGSDSRNPIAGRAVNINAQMAAAEASYNRDWLRFKGSFLFASGDGKPLDGAARGFDSILDFPEFAGGRFSFWNSQGIRLTRTGLNLVNQNSLLPSLRSNKFAGQANFVNPGIFIYNCGLDADLTHKVKAVFNLNYLHFHHTQPLETLLQKSGVGEKIGLDYGVGVRLRPFLNENAIIDAGYSSLITGAGFNEIYSPGCASVNCAAKGKALHSVFVRLRVVY